MEPVFRELTAGHENCQRDREIEGRAILADIGWCEVDRNAPEREEKSGIDESRAHPFAALFDSALGQPDRREGRQPVGDVHFDVHWVRVDSEYGSGADSGQHGSAPDSGAGT